MKVGDLFRGHRHENQLADDVQECVRSARVAFGHIEGRSDIECLALAVMSTSRRNRELQRNLSAWMARARNFEVRCERMARALD